MPKKAETASKSLQKGEMKAGSPDVTTQYPFSPRMRGLQYQRGGTRVSPWKDCSTNVEVLVT